MSKDRLGSLLWDGSAPRGALATLESYVCLLRKKLQPCKATSSSLIKTQAGCYAIDMSRVDLDLVRYERLLSRGLHPDTPAPEALPILQQAVTLAEPPLLPEENDCEWLDELRKIHNQKVRQGLIAAATKVVALPTDAGQRWAKLALDGDTLDESAWYASPEEHGGQRSTSRGPEGLRPVPKAPRIRVGLQFGARAAGGVRAASSRGARRRRGAEPAL